MFKLNNSIIYKKIVILTTIFLYSFIVIFVFIASVPSSTIYIPETYKIGIKTLFPQGWAFFTKNPMDDQIDVYGIENCSLIKLNIKNTDSENFYGLKRTSRLQGVEISKLIEQIRFQDWIELESGFKDVKSIFKTLQFNNKSVEILNISLNPSICGSVLFCVHKPVPWAWSRSNNVIYPPCKISMVYVKCNNK